MCLIGNHDNDNPAPPVESPSPSQGLRVISGFLQIHTQKIDYVYVFA
jgi:hypothetical protein